MTAPATTIWAQVAELDAAVSRAQARLTEREAQRSKAPRLLAAARAELAEYDEGVGGGEHDPDAAREAELERRVRELEAGLRPRSLAGGVPVDVDERAEARAHGARRALQAAVLERDDFTRRHAAGLFAELAPEAEAARAALEQAIPVLAAADRADQDVRRRARRVMDAAGIPAADMPASGVRGWADDVVLSGIPLALPRSVVRDRGA